MCVVGLLESPVAVQRLRAALERRPDVRATLLQQPWTIPLPDQRERRLGSVVATAAP